jgi:SNF2 family DNA or RNA helicase
MVIDFQDPNHPLRFFVGQPRTGGYGLTLTEASTVIYFSNNYDLEIRLQSEDRAHRIGQKNNVTYIDIVTEGTVDENGEDLGRDPHCRCVLARRHLDLNRLALHNPPPAVGRR